MPPRKPPNRRAVPPPDPKPSLPSPASTSLPADLQASTSQDNFDLDNVSGSDESDRGDVVEINNPDTAPTLRQRSQFAPDILYFYDKTGDLSICKECR
jgi:hypothetical protein